MPVLFLYLLKLSLSLAVVFLFYQIILRKLTFYHSNRWYLLGYSAISFVIPFINIGPVLEHSRWSHHAAINWIPVLQMQEPPSEVLPSTGAVYSIWDFASVLLVSGMVLFFLRILIQWISFRRMLRRATLLTRDGMHLYQVDAPIIPFSFGQSIFINRHQHEAEELEEIIRHEFVHVRQRHSIDILWAEWLCLFNWYNPFAWLLRKAIRQNLEFIADHHVLEQGCSRKQYQYLLLRVMGNSQFSIATQFNFTSLKKRIAMMNKTKSAKRQLLRLLFLLPATAVLLLAFRNQWSSEKQDPARGVDTLSPTQSNNRDSRQSVSFANQDTVPVSPGLNKKGYEAAILQNNGNPVVSIRNASGKEVDRTLLSNWKKESGTYESKYGELLLPPTPPPTPPVPPVPPVVTEQSVPPPPPPVVEAASETTSRIQSTAPLQAVTEPLQEVRIQPVVATTIRTGSGSTSEPVRVVSLSGTTNVNSTPARLTDVKVVNRAAPVQAMNRTGRKTVSTDYADAIANGQEIVRITITNRTSRADLDAFVAKMKAKGVELTFDEINYSNKGTLEHINGTMRSGNTHGNFSGTDFGRLVLSVIQNEGKIYFRILTSDTPELI